MSVQKPQPYSTFGLALRRLREQKSKSQAEVSGAVEIERNKLISYETGEVRPSEDILLLLIQHFALQNREARELWRLAGYHDSNYGNAEFFMNDDQGGVEQARTELAHQSELQIVYTDMIQVMVNNYGVILNFMQGAGVNSKPLAVAKVGMSKEHTKSVLEVLKKTLEQADVIDHRNNSEPKRISAGNQK